MWTWVEKNTQDCISGFDKKQNTVVILDKNLNLIEVLQRVAVN